MKYCPTCKIDKNETEFGPNAARHDKLSSHCRCCVKILTNKYKETINASRRNDYNTNIDKYKQKAAASYQRNRDKRLIDQKEYYESHKEKCNIASKEYYQDNRERLISEQVKRDSTPEALDRKAKWKKQWRKDNPEKRRAAEVRYLSKNPIRKIAKLLRNRIFVLLRQRKANKVCPTMKQVGCSFEELKKYIEFKFYDRQESGNLIKMSWDNFGSGDGKWQIDHIIPICSFNLNIPEEQLKANHYSNLQPLWNNDHLIKTRFDIKFIDICQQLDYFSLI